MLPVIVGLLLILLIALAILALVALPQIRSGSRILTPTGGRVVGQALEQTRQRPVAAVRGGWRILVLTTRALIAARGRISVAWAPIGAVLHDAMDRLEAKSVATTSVSSGTSVPAENVVPMIELIATGTLGSVENVVPMAELIPTGASEPAESVTPPAAELGRTSPGRSVPSGPKQQRFDVAAIIGSRSVGRPRAIPPVSGPIRTTASGATRSGADAVDVAPSDRADQVIDLRPDDDLAEEATAQTVAARRG